MDNVASEDLTTNPLPTASCVAAAMPLPRIGTPKPIGERSFGMTTATR